MHPAANRIERSFTDLANNTSSKWVYIYPGVIVPGITGLQYATADSILKTMELYADTIWVPDTNFQTGTVILQQPAAGNTIRTGFPVKITLALGKGACDLVPVRVDATGLIYNPDFKIVEGTVDVDIVNFGTRAIAENFRIVLFEDRNYDKSYESAVDNIIADTMLTAGLYAEDTMHISFNVKDSILFRDGVIHAFVDVGNTINETNEKNNYATSMAACNAKNENRLIDPALEWKYTKGYGVWKSPRVAQLNDDNADGEINENDVPDIICIGMTWHADLGTLLAIDGASGDTLFTCYDTLRTQENIAVADIDNDKRVEIITVASGKVNPHGSKCIQVYENDGSVKWRGEEIYIGATSNGGEDVAVADLDHDGFGEIIWGPNVYDHNGSLRWPDKIKPLTGNITYFDYVTTCDIDLDGDLEIIAQQGGYDNGSYKDGPTVYEMDGSILWRADIGGDCYITANYNNDPFPELISGGGTTSGIHIITHNGELLKIIHPILPNGDTIMAIHSPIFFGDINHDSNNEFVSVGGVLDENRNSRISDIIFASDTSGRVIWSYQFDKLYDSRRNLVTFDIDNDGVLEIIQNTNEDLYIFKGSNGEILSKISGQFSIDDYPVIADIDNDNSAEIIMPKLNYGEKGIYVYGSATGSWSNTRKIWNQFSYHVSDINDDGTLPRFEEPLWQKNINCLTQIKKNSSACNDLSASMLTYDNTRCGSNTLLHARIGNCGATALPAGIPIAVYNNNNLIDSLKLKNALNPGQYEDIACTLSVQLRGVNTVCVAADDDGTGHSGIFESDEQNNRAVATFNFCNSNPFITSHPITSGDYGVQYSYQIQATDPENDSLKFHLLSAPSAMSIDSLTGVIIWNPVAGDPGRNYITVETSDPYGGKGTQSFTLYIGASSNHAPLIRSAAPLTAKANTIFDNQLSVYRYNVFATDADAGDTLRYYLGFNGEPAATSMKIDSITGEITWTPFFPFVEQGVTYHARVMVCDTRGGSAVQDFTVLIDQRSNTAPVFANKPDTTVAENGHYVFIPEIFDVDNDPVTFWLKKAPAGMTIQNGSIIYTPASNATGKHIVTIAATDNRDTTLLQYILTVTNVNNAPEIISSPPLAVSEGETYRYQLETRDLDNDLLVYTLVSAPTGMVISQTGCITWTDNSNRQNNASVIVRASDDSSAHDEQSWSIAIVPDTIAPVVAILANPNPVYPGDSTIISVSATDNASISTLQLFVDNVPVTPDGNGNYVFHTVNEDTIECRAYATDVNGNSDTSAAYIYVNLTADAQPPQVEISFTPSNPVAGGTVDFSVTATDRTLDRERVWLRIDNEYIPLDLNGNGVWSAARSGLFKAVATAYDSSGNYGDASVNVAVTSSLIDTVAPQAAILSPEDDTVITKMIALTGSATDENFAYYTLSYRRTDDTAHTEYFRSTTPVTIGPLGYIDGTNLYNGDYVIRLTVFDRNGSSASDEVQVRVEGQLKVGLFSLAFTDMSINLPGMDLSVNRAYDSRDKLQGDFGYGWKLDLRSVKLSESRSPGDDWEVQYVGGIPGSWKFGSAYSHTISIAIPGGRTQVFDAVPVFNNQFDPTYGDMTFVAKPGIYSTLTPLDCSTEFVVMGSALYDLNGDFQQTWNPDRYRLTFADGTAYDIDQAEGGVVHTSDNNNNSIDITESAVRHSTGKTISIIRDMLHRITAIRDIDGRSVTYTYDPHGNLAKVTDLNGNITRFKYAPNHYLTEIIDPRGVRAVRTEYDDNGRMVRQINAEGDTMRFDHDIVNNREVTKDFNGNETRYVYDNHGNVTEKRDQLNNVWYYTYDSLDNVIETRDPLNHVITSIFDEKGNEISLTDALNRTTTRTFNAKNQILTETDALNRTTTYAYDTRGNLLSITGSGGIIKEQKTYDTRGNVLTQRDALGNISSYEYDGSGRLIRQFDPLGRKTEYKLDNRGNTTMQIGPAGDTIRYLYDAMDNQIMSVNAMGDTVLTIYNVFNKTASQTDALGNVTVFEYDLFGQLSRTIAPDGTAVSKQYDSQGNVVQSIDEVGRVTQFEYDHESRIKRTIANDGSSTRVEYDALGRRAASIDANGNRTEYEYDAVGNNTVVRDALGNETIYEYDAANRRTAMVDALNHRTEYGYDDYDRLIRTTFHNGTFSTTTYDLAGRKIVETDPEGKTTAFAYDSVGNLKSVTDAMGHVTQYTYDAHNNRISQTDANNHTTTMQYDKLNRLTTRIYPNGDTERFGYDENGNQLYKIDGNGDSTVYSYDNRNREILKRFTNSGHTVETRYTDDGKPDTVVDHRGMTVYTYENCGRQASVVNPDSTFIESIYDNNGNRTEQRTPFDTVTFTYDVLYRMSEVRTLSGVEGSGTKYFYNEVGNRDSAHNVNGTSTGYDYDDLNRLTKVTNYAPDQSVISSYEYELNNAGIRTSVTESDGSRVDFDYDDCYKLTGETRTGGSASSPTGYTISFTYDNVGNRLTQVRGGVTKSYTYNNRDQLTQEDSVGVITIYSYDPAGRMLNKTVAGNATTYGWEDNDRMVSVTGPGVSVTYTYDHNEQRVSESNATGTMHYLIDYQLPYGQVIADFDENGVKASYVYGLERISLERNGTTFTYLVDGQGSIRNLTDTTGNVTDSYYYTAFGEQLVEIGATANRFRYVGEQWDVNAGFYYNRARWMDPSRGRFVSVDPFAGDPQAPVSLHRYLYANSSPISHSDPNGKMTLVDCSVAMAISGILMASTITIQQVYKNTADDFAFDNNVSNGLLNLASEIHKYPLAMSAVVTVTWVQVVEMIKTKTEELKKKLKNNKKYDGLQTGPSKEYGAKFDNWIQPIKTGTRMWYRDGGPYSGRLNAFGLWISTSGIGSHIPIAELDLHPIPSAYGSAEVLHAHIGDHTGPHLVLGVVQK
jgi:RHS repeat-associated protein